MSTVSAKGLNNTHSVCYMNSLLQCMLSCTPLTNIFLTYNMLPLFQHNPVVEVYHNLVQWSQGNSDTPGDFGIAMIFAIRKFKGNPNLFPFGFQHDTAEVYATILECWNNINIIRNLFTTHKKTYFSCRVCTTGDHCDVSEVCKRSRFSNTGEISVDSSSFHAMMKDQDISSEAIVNSINMDRGVQFKHCELCTSEIANVYTHSDLPTILVIQITSTAETTASQSVRFPKTDVQSMKVYQLMGQVTHSNLHRRSDYGTSGHYTAIVSRSNGYRAEPTSINDATVEGYSDPEFSLGNRLLFYVQ